ncbi:MAG TPA: hypothetical protein VGP93_15205 [Polyangiaceae bacterium]|nr:hypothetical protein [Polyangiaceae bacterium]
MNFEKFSELIQSESAPEGLSLLLLALWRDARGDWSGAHEAAQEVEGADGAWVHAYLHRKEGDLANASYWYQQAGRSALTGALDEEWELIARELCTR